MELSENEKTLLRICFQTRIDGIRNKKSWEPYIKSCAIADMKPLWIKLGLGEWLW